MLILCDTMDMRPYGTSQQLAVRRERALGGDGWQELESTAVSNGPAQIYLGNGSVNAGQAFTTYFDDFKVNSGLTSYNP